MEVPPWANTRRVICKIPSFRKDKIVQKQKEQVIYFFKATSRRQSGLFVNQITLKGYRMPQSYHSLKSKNILKSATDNRGKKLKKKPGHLTSLSDNTLISLQ